MLILSALIQFQFIDQSEVTYRLLKAFAYIFIIITLLIAFYLYIIVHYDLKKYKRIDEKRISHELFVEISGNSKSQLNYNVYFFMRRFIFAFLLFYLGRYKESSFFMLIVTIIGASI